AGLVAATLIVPRFNLSVVTVVMTTLAVPALTIVILENLYIKSRIAFRPVRSGGYSAAAIGYPSSRRVVLKIVRLAASIAALAVIYWLFTFYRDGGVNDLITLVQHLSLPLFLLAPLYIWYADKKSRAPEDGYFHVGLYLTGSRRRADRDLVRQHCLQWFVKA